MSILEVQNLSFQIGARSILSDISFQVSQGETIGLIGPNGSGKTSLFNCLSGFNNPQVGTIIFRDQDITCLPAFKRAEMGIGRVFQSFGVFRNMTILENMTAALESRQSPFATFFPWSKRNRINKRKALGFLRQINLAEKAQDKAGSLSGGQMRLLEIMRTLAFKADVFLLDEPTAGVSPKMKDDVAQIILKLKKLKKTVLVIEHDLNFTQKFCERILVLDQGSIVLDNTPENVRNNRLLQEIYFGS